MAVRFSEAFRDESVERTADCLRRRAAKHLLGRGVEQRDSLVSVNCQNRVGRGGDDP
jgi:hypothetical protein